ncbi:MAG: phytanoyl-CoA dioxygenase family protein [Pseudomonadota bacterium]
MKYAQLTPGSGFAPLRSALYYSQRIVTFLFLRRLVVLAVGGVLRLWHGDRMAPHPASGSEDSALEQLSREGYAALGNLLSPGQCDTIHAFMAHKLLSDRHNAGAPFTLSSVPKGVRLADYHLRDIIACPHIMELANSPLLLGLATRYIGCKPTISAIGLRWSFPEPAGSSQLQAFHRDSEDWRYLKVLVYLTDVGSSAGPHVYLRGSHLTRAPVRLRFHSDQEIDNAYTPEQLVTATGMRGFGFAVDTAGIHKGAAPSGEARLMLQIQYSLLPCYAYRYAPERYSGDLALDAYINRLIIA